MAQFRCCHRNFVSAFFVAAQLLIFMLPALVQSSADTSSEADHEIPSDEWFKEKKLVKMLLSQQDGRQLGRPVSNFTQPVEVEFGINLIQVLRVNEDAGQLITNIWTHFRWRDPSLSWNHSAIGVDIVRIPAEEIWTPDVALFNYADDRMRQHRSTLAVVNATGHIDWIPTGIFKSACSIDTFSFPFDEQLCYMTFRSLSNGVATLTLKFVDSRESMSLDSYVPNPEWEITENSAIRSIKVGKRGMKTSFYDLTFTLRLKRRSVFHRYVLVLPCVLLSLTAGVLFMLPPESPAKIQIGIFIFQGFFLLLNLLKNSTPPSGSRSPIIGLYYSTSMIATTVVMFCCGFLVEIHFRADRKAPMSDRVRNIVIKTLAQWLFIPTPAKSPLDIKREQKLASSAMAAARHSINTRAAGSPAIGARCATPLLANDQAMAAAAMTPSVAGGVSRSSSQRRKSLGDTARKRISSWGKSIMSGMASQADGHDGTRDDSSTASGVLGDLIELRKTFQRVAEKQAAREYTALVQREWLIAIMVFDRIFFFIYISWIILSLYMLLPQEELK